MTFRVACFRLQVALLAAIVSTPVSLAADGEEKPFPIFRVPSGMRCDTKIYAGMEAIAEQAAKLTAAFPVEAQAIAFAPNAQLYFLRAKRVYRHPDRPYRAS